MDDLAAYTFTMIVATRNLISIGRLASRLDTTTERIAELAEAIGVQAAETIDGILFLDANDIERLREALINQTTRETQPG
jgi:hypothetical protein